MGKDGKTVKERNKVCNETLNLSSLLLDGPFYLHFTSKLFQWHRII